MSDKKTALVISAHAADFVWRAGGAIALHQSLGYEVTVACLSYGERGESAKLWKQEGMTLERVKEAVVLRVAHQRHAIRVVRRSKGPQDRLQRCRQLVRLALTPGVNRPLIKLANQVERVLNRVVATHRRGQAVELEGLWRGSRGGPGRSGGRFG